MAATQRLGLDPKIWARIRRTAFDRETSATKLIETVMVEYLDRLEADGGKTTFDPRASDPRAGMAASLPTAQLAAPSLATQPQMIVNTRSNSVATTTVRTRDQAAAVFDATKQWLEEDPSAALSPKAAAVLFGTEPVKIHEGHPVSVGAVLTSPDDVPAAVASFGIKREFHPVPKPSSKKKERK